MNYKPPRTRNLYTPGSDKPFKLSRSRVELFMSCPRCFYLDRRFGVDRPPGFPFNLNSAVDALLKKEFDLYREKQQPHPLMVQNNVDAIPFQHPDIERWRHNFTGVQYLHPDTNLLLFGAVDDIWQQSDERLIVVDYKATSKGGEITLDAEWQNSYKRQMEFYQYLLRRNGLEVSHSGYFVYCNGRRDLEQFNSKLEFDIHVLAYTGSDDWIEETIIEIHRCLNAEQIPLASSNCDFCKYSVAISSATS